MAAPYTDQLVFPEIVLLDLPESAHRRFPGWTGPVLVISVENQGVCAWGVPLGNDNPEILVGGEIQDRAGWVRGTKRYCRDRRYDWRPVLDERTACAVQALALNDDKEIWNLKNGSCGLVFSRAGLPHSSPSSCNSHPRGRPEPAWRSPRRRGRT